MKIKIFSNERKWKAEATVFAGVCKVLDSPHQKENKQPSKRKLKRNPRQQTMLKQNAKKFFREIKIEGIFETLEVTEIQGRVVKTFNPKL